MPESDQGASPNNAGLYDNEDELQQEILRFLSTRPNNCGASEHEIIRV
jgi:hypothetical protein